MQTTQLNKITLCGIVGSSRIFEANGTKHTKFTLVTTRAYTGMDKTPALETTWFNCQTPPVSGKLEKGSKVMLQGRMRSVSYRKEDGTVHTSYEVIASSVEILPEDTTLLFQDDRNEEE